MAPGSLGRWPGLLHCRDGAVGARNSASVLSSNWSRALTPRRREARLKLAKRKPFCALRESGGEHVPRGACSPSTAPRAQTSQEPNKCSRGEHRGATSTVMLNAAWPGCQMPPSNPSPVLSLQIPTVPTSLPTLGFAGNAGNATALCVLSRVWILLLSITSAVFCARRPLLARAFLPGLAGGRCLLGLVSGAGGARASDRRAFSCTGR